MSCPFRPSRSRRSRSTRPWSAAASCTLVRSLLLGLLLLAASAGLFAHELGTIRVTARFQKDGTYRIDAIVDREHLPPGFDAGGKIDPRFGTIRNLTPELEQQLHGLIAHAINGVRIAF